MKPAYDQVSSPSPKSSPSPSPSPSPSSPSPSPSPPPAPAPSSSSSPSPYPAGRRVQGLELRPDRRQRLHCLRQGAVRRQRRARPTTPTPTLPLPLVLTLTLCDANDVRFSLPACLPPPPFFPSLPPFHPCLVPSLSPVPSTRASHDNDVRQQRAPYPAPRRPFQSSIVPWTPPSQPSAAPFIAPSPRPIPSLAQPDRSRPTL